MCSFQVIYKYLTKQKKCENGKEVTELAESLGLTVAKLSRYPVATLTKEDIGKKCNVSVSANREMFV